MLLKNKQTIQEPEQNNMEPQKNEPPKNGSIKNSGTVACFDWTESLVIAVVVVGFESSPLSFVL